MIQPPLMKKATPEERQFWTALGYHIRAWRTRRKLSRAQFAELTGLPSVVDRIERGQQRVNIYQAVRIAKVLGVDVLTLMSSPTVHQETP